MGNILGIDLGTTNSVMAAMIGDEPVVIPSAEGERLIPSVVALSKNGERLVGRPARNQAIVNAQNTIFSVKRFMGRRFDDDVVQQARARVPYEVLTAENGDVRVRLGGKPMAPPEISAMILAKLKADAEAFLNQEITQAVITVPAYFNDAQRSATRDAGQIAGLEVLRIVNEPTASSLAYGLEKMKNETIVVYDLGGGTFDVSVLNVGEGVFEVKSTSGDTFLGGDDFDQQVMDFLLREFEREHGVRLQEDRQALQRLKEAAEKAKIELSSTLQTDINLPYLTATASGPKHLSLSLTRARLEQLTADLIERTLLPVRQALQDAGLTPSKIQDVVLVGGMTRMPAVQEAVRRFFNREPHKGVNPDEVVAIGAALQGGVLSGKVKDLLLLDVTPLSLCIETVGGVATPVIPRNSAIPTRTTEIFSTALDNQPQVEVHIVQGERAMAAQNKDLGRFILDGIPPAPRGIPQIEVTFDLDANGILKVTARDKSTGRSQNITLTASSGLMKEEIEAMRQDAQRNAQADREKREAAQARNEAEELLFQAEAWLQQHGFQAPQVVRAEISEAVSGLRSVLESGDAHLIRTRAEILRLALQSLRGDSAPGNDAQTKIL